MTPTVRVLRVALPIAFFAFIALLFASYRSNVRDENRPQTVIPKDLKRPEDPALIARMFEDVQTIAGRVALKISADRTVAFESGWYTLEGVKFTMFQRDGRAFTVVAPQAQVNAKTREADIKGGVRITSNDGIEVVTQSIHFDGTRILNEKIPVSFKIDDWSGSGGGLDFNIKDETLKLVEPVKASFQPRKPGEPRIDLSAVEATFERRTGNVTFSKDVRVLRQRDSLDAQTVIGRFDQRQKRLTALEGTGGVVMQMAENSGLGGSGGGASSVGKTTVNAERFYTEFGAAGEILAVHIVSENGPARAFTEGVPRRTITAPHFRVMVPNGVLQEIRADNHVTLTEESSPPRVVTSFAMTLYFDAAARRASNALLDGGVTYREARSLATADRATYDLRSRRLLLTAVPQVAPRLQTESEVLRANTIEVLGVEQIMKATGNVFVELKPKHAGGQTAANDSGLFPERSPVFVNADTATFKRAEKAAWFNGNVRAWQGTNTLFTKDLHIANGGESLVATGGVRSVLNNVKAAAAGKPSTVLASSNELTARRAERRVDLSGSVNVTESGRILQSDKATLFLDAKQKLDRVEASGKVTINEPATKRKGAAEKATYRLARKNVTLLGSPAEITDPRGTVKGTEILIDLEKNKVSVISGATPTEATYNPQ